MTKRAMPPQGRQNKAFDAEFLSVRKDIPEIQLAAAVGDLEKIQELLKFNELWLNEENKDGNTLLLLATANGHLETVDFLLKAGANMSHQNGFKMDALDYATMDHIRTPMAKIVISYCEYVIPQALDGKYWQQCDRALSALKQKNVFLAKSLMAGRPPDFAPLAKKSEYREQWLRDIAYLVSMVKKGFLMLSSDIGYLENDAVLVGPLELPARDRYVYDIDKGTVLPFAQAKAEYWDPIFVDRFISASGAGNILAISGLLKSKGSANSEDDEGKTALMHAAENGSSVVLTRLIQAGAKVNQVNKDGFSAFLIAAVKGKEEAVRVLMRAKADLNALSFKGNSVLNFVKHEGKKQILDIIQEIRDEEQNALDQLKLEEVRKKAANAARKSGGGILRGYK